ncbi:MAG: dihydroorotase family protein [Bacilli bacterium]
MYDYAIRDGKLYIDGRWEHLNLYIANGEIAYIGQEEFPAKEIIDAEGLEVLPGIIDPHVHFDLDLGKIHSVDDFYFGSVAASYGGVSTIIDFLDPVSNAEELESAFHKRLALAKDSLVDFQLHATIKQPTGSIEAFVQKMKSLGIHTVKLFTTYSDSGRRTNDEDIITLLKLSAQYNFLVMAHIENDDLIDLNPTYTYRDLSKSRPSESETVEALKLAGYVKKYGGKLYMVHCSSGKTLEALVNTYPELINQSLFIESCPQYFTFSIDDLQKADGHLYTCAPPLRKKEEQNLLFKYASYLSTIGTDHCSFNRRDKAQQYLKDTPLGVGGIEFALPIMRKHLGDAVIEKMTSNVARLMGLKKKGVLKVGYDADLTFYQPEDVTISSSHGRADYSLYIGHKVFGRVVSTMVRGKFVMRQQKIVGDHGHWIKGNDIL